MPKFVRYFVALTVLASTSTSLLAADKLEWPQFRGRDSRGVSTNDKLPLEWNEDEKQNIAWKVAVPGRSWSSPIVSGNRVFITSAVSKGKNHEPKKGLYFGGNRPKPLPDEHRWVLLCYDLESGKLIWEKEAFRGKPATGIHVKNTYASETPATDGERVYAYFGGVGLYAYDFEGERVWFQEMEPVPTRYGWGSAGSPIVHKGRVYIVNDNDKASWIAAYDAKSGKELWKVPRKERSNWSTPYIWETEKRSEIVTLGTDKVRSYDLDGKILWELKGMSSITIATPYEANGLLHISSGYVGDSHKPSYAIKPGAKGDISLKAGELSNEFIAWCQPKAAPYNPTTLVYGDQLFTLLDFGFMLSYNANTGKQIYKKNRLTVGVGFTASPWAYRDHVFCLDEDGTTHVIKTGPKFEVVRKNQLNEMCMATPALAGDRLLIRGLNSLYCIQEK